VLPPEDVEIVVIDADDSHVYQPGLLFVPFGLANPGRLVRPRSRQFRAGVEFWRGAVDAVDLDSDTVRLVDGTSLSYDVLVVASGAGLRSDETDGLTGPGWGQRVHTFYDLAGATALAGALADFDGGRLVVNVVDMPIKCPVAPLEFSFLADWFLRRGGRRGKVELTLATPLDGAFTKPTASRHLSGLLDRKGVELVTEFNTGEVDGAGGRLVSYDGREIGFDLAVVVPLHGGAAYVGRSAGLGDELDFVPTAATLQAKARPNVFVIGDATDLRASKAGSVAHFEGDVLVPNVVSFLAGEPLEACFHGHANCFVETGFAKALLIDFDDDHEPVPGHFPGPIGLPLLRESRLAHLGKVAFEHLYWRVLLPGHDIPFVGSDMPLSGKRIPATSTV
jgi:sulfide:quinone oxidoreductase